MNYFYAFITGGIICVIGQVLIDKTKLTSARILVGFVVVGCLLSGVGIYEKIVEFGGAGATVPLPGFGHLLSEGVKEEIDKIGWFGIFTGGLKAASSGITCVMLFSFINALLFDSKPKN